MPEVKAERIPLRQRQALETRRAIVRAARALFAERGYSATSLELVADEAGVAARTVYSVFGSKKGILAAICEDWLTEAGIMDSIAAGLAEPDPRRRLAIVAHASRRQWESDKGVRMLLAGAAASDAEVDRMLSGWRDDRARSLGSVLAGFESELRAGIDPARARAILTALTGAEIFWELVTREGWSGAAYEEWLAALLAEVLLKPD
jgi:AcrR family transcriptional regulator